MAESVCGEGRVELGLYAVTSGKSKEIEIDQGICDELERHGVRLRFFEKKSEIKDVLGVVVLVFNDDCGLDSIKKRYLTTIKTISRRSLPFASAVLYDSRIPGIDMFIALEGLQIAFDLKRLKDDVEEKMRFADFLKRAARRFVVAQYGEVPALEYPHLRRLMLKKIDWKVKADGGDSLFLMTTSMTSSDMWKTLTRFIEDARKWGEDKRRVYSLLMTGPTGSGKTELAVRVAQMITGKDPLKVNMVSIPKELVSSHLFGHAKGAFTGAGSDRPGYIAEAYREGKVLILDEIGEISPEDQVKLLTYMDDGYVQKVGIDRPEKKPIILIGTTNRDIQRAVAEGLLRQDFVYRWQYRIDLPGLSERGRDIRFVISYLLQREDVNPSVKGGVRRVNYITITAIEYIERLPLEGNFRQLMHLLRMGVHNAYLEGTDVLQLRHLVRR